LINSSSLYLLFGFLVAGLIFTFISSENVIRYFGKGKIKSVVMASLVGIPLPLCSCGVLPAAAGLRKKAAGKASVVSFLISTPESGVDSIAITWGLLGPIMAFARPVAAFITAFIAGGAQAVFDNDKIPETTEIDMSCPVDKCCDGIDCPAEVHRRHHTFYEKVISGMKFSFGPLLSDIAVWLVIGFIFAGLISYLIPGDFISEFFGSSLSAKFFMLMIGIPIYICATASTPVAAALIMKGMSPGTALVFLMAGPATNVASLTVISRLIGRKATAIYLISISVCSVLLGILLDYICFYFAVSPVTGSGIYHSGSHGYTGMFASFVLISIFGFSFIKKFHAGCSESKKKSCCHSEKEG